jgi:superoxide reductase
MATTRREFLRLGMASGLTAAAVLSGGRLLAQEAMDDGYQHPQDPAHLSALEMKHWPKLTVVGRATPGQPFDLSIQIGQEIHPMTPEHHIEWVEVWAGGKRLERMDFNEPTWVKPVLTVQLVANAPTEFTVRLRCNLHGLWENSIKV